MWLAMLILFVVLCPGVVFTMPGLGKKMRGKIVTAAMHAVVFVIAVNLLDAAEGFATAMANSGDSPAAEEAAERWAAAKRAAVRAKEAEARMSPPMSKEQEAARKALYAAEVAAEEKAEEDEEIYKAAERVAYQARNAANNIRRQVGAEAAAQAAQLDRHTAALTRLQIAVNASLEAQKEAKELNAGGGNSWTSALGL